jgi:hypothetical protein
MRTHARWRAPACKKPPLFVAHAEPNRVISNQLAKRSYGGHSICSGHNANDSASVYLVRGVRICIFVRGIIIELGRVRPCSLMGQSLQCRFSARGDGREQWLKQQTAERESKRSRISFWEFPIGGYLRKSWLSRPESLFLVWEK